ncbi:MAG: AraC family transcriptional regulator [Roseburia sp.]|nr:AraC family transcriptional regulator [Roseburia sp.]MCM1243480.1 AraC family transcriptional regulator [Roseburia sp.]
MNEVVMSEDVMPIVDGCNLCAAAEGFVHADRVLDFHVLIYVLEGVIYVTEEGTDYAVEAGELLFLKKGLRHFGKVEIPKGTRWYYVHFYLDAESRRRHDEGRRTTLPKKMSHLAGSVPEKKLAALIDCARSGDDTTSWYLNMRLFELLSLCAFFGKKESKETLSEEICLYLQARKKEAFSARDMERHFYLSYKHMAAVFKKEKQMTMQQYHTKLRVEEACRLLESTLLPVGEIGRQLGYEDMLYFSRIFRRSTGMSPTAYRKRALTLY